MATYQEFFCKSFNLNEDGNINLEAFVEFFLKEDNNSFENFDDKKLKQLYNDMQPFDQENIL